MSETDMTDNILNALNIQSTVVPDESEVETLPVLVHPTETLPAVTKQDVQQDQSAVRQNLIATISIGLQSLSTLSAHAKDSGHPRAFEVIGSLMRAVLEANRDLVSLGKLNEKNNPGTNLGSKPQTDIGVQNNHNRTIVVGSMGELQKLIEETDQSNVIEGTITNGPSEEDS